MLKQICPFSSTVSIIDKLMKAASITELFLNFFFFFFLFTITDPIMKCSDILQWPLRKAQINYNQFLTSTSAASRQLLPILEAFVAKELLGYILFKKK